VGDLETKLKQAREFLEEGDKVKFSMRFRGREIAYLDLGRKKFDQIAERLADVATVDERSPTSGRMIHIVFAPAKKKAAPLPGAAKAPSEGKVSEKKIAPPSKPANPAPLAGSSEGDSPSKPGE
jgi:translation initiation factor IF-3